MLQVRISKPIPNYEFFQDATDSRLTGTPLLSKVGGGYYALRHMNRALIPYAPSWSLEVVRFDSQFSYLGFSVIAIEQSPPTSFSVHQDGMLLITYGGKVAVVDPVEGSLLDPRTPPAPQ